MDQNQKSSYCKLVLEFPMQLSQYMQNRNLCSFDINRLNLLHSDPVTSWELSDSNPETPFITWWGVALHRSRQDRSPRTGWGGSATCRRPTVHHHTHTTLFHFLDIFPFNPEIFYTLGHNDPILLCAFSKKGRYCVQRELAFIATLVHMAPWVHIEHSIPEF